MAARGSKKSLLPGGLPRPSSSSLRSDQLAQNEPVTPSSMPAACLSILAVELCERVAYYTITGTQESFLERHGYSLAQAGGLNAAMGTLCMAWAIFAGWVADVRLGRYKTIVYFGTCYILGAVVTAAAAWPGFASARVYLAGVMLLVPIGTAGIKANISNFGADQYDTWDPAQAAAQETFFSWFYLAINIGAALAYGCLTTLGSNGGLGVPKRYGYFAVYTAAAACMSTAIMMFTWNRPRYYIQGLQQHSAVGVVVRTVVQAAARGSGRALVVCSGAILLLASVTISVVGALMPANPGNQRYSTLVAFVCAGIGTLSITLPCLRPSWLAVAYMPDERISCADVRSFLRLLPVLFSATLAFNSLYNSMQYWYQQQACQMDLRMPFSVQGAQFAGSFFMIADCLGIVVATPMAVRWFNPMLERACGGSFCHGTKYGMGMLFGAASVLTAARLEIYRKRAPLLALASNCAPDGVRMSFLSAVYMILPFFLMGIGEIYTQPVLMHFAYSRSPANMRTLAIAATMVINAVSTALFAAQIGALSRYVPNNLNEGHLEYGYYLNIAVAGLLYSAFVYALQSFEATRSESSIA